MFSLLAECLVLIHEFKFKEEFGIFQVNFTLSTTNEKIFATNRGPSRYLPMMVGCCMHQNFYQTVVEPCQNLKVKCHI